MAWRGGKTDVEVCCTSCTTSYSWWFVVAVVGGRRVAQRGDEGDGERIRRMDWAVLWDQTTVVSCSTLFDIRFSFLSQVWCPSCGTGQVVPPAIKSKWHPCLGAASTGCECVCKKCSHRFCANCKERHHFGPENCYLAQSVRARAERDFAKRIENLQNQKGSINVGWCCPPVFRRTLLTTLCWVERSRKAKNSEHHEENVSFSTSSIR